MPADTWTWDDVETAVVPRTTTVALCLDGTVQADLDDARRRLRAAKAEDTLQSDTAELQAAVDDLEARAEQATRRFEIHAIPHSRWRDLLTEHRSTDPAERYDAATFVPAAIAACCRQFTSAEQVAKAADTALTTGQISKLFAAVRKMNEGDDQVPTSRGR